MFIRVDLAEVPPVVTLEDAEDLKAFKVVLDVPEHAWVDRDAVIRLAGREDDHEWVAAVQGMIDFAASRGWVDESGRIRAHVETRIDG